MEKIYFQHHPDGFIYINGEEFTLEFFSSVEPRYALPEVAIGRLYEPGKRDCLFTTQDNGTQIGGEGDPVTRIWDEGDTYISKVAEYVTLRDTQTEDDYTIDKKRDEAKLAIHIEYKKRLAATDPLRQKAEELKTQIDSLTETEIDNFDVTDDTKWNLT